MKAGHKFLTGRPLEMENDQRSLDDGQFKLEDGQSNGILAIDF